VLLAATATQSTQVAIPASAVWLPTPLSLGHHPCFGVCCALLCGHRCITVLSVDVAGYDLPALAMKFFGRVQGAAQALLGHDDEQAEGGQSFYEKIGLLKEDFDEFKTKVWTWLAV